MLGIKTCFTTSYLLEYERLISQGEFYSGGVLVQGPPSVDKPSLERDCSLLCG